jgi:hypothetical protein
MVFKAFKSKWTSGAVKTLLVNLVHELTVPQEQIAAVFQFPDREGIAEMAEGLVLHPEAKAQTSAIEPALTESLERGGQLLTQQASGEKIDGGEIAARDKAIAFLDHAIVLAAGLALDPFMAIENDLGAKGRIATHAHHDMAPIRIEDLEVVMLDVGPGILVSQIQDLAFGTELDPPNGAGSSSDQHGKSALELGIFGEKRLGDLAFVLSGVAIDPGDTVLAAPSF